MRPKDIGTAGETAVVKYLRKHGFGNAERRALTGSLDQGDITGCPGIVWEVKAGKAAETASDGQIAKWLEETETERQNAKADVGILVVKRKGIGPDNAGKWWAIVYADAEVVTRDPGRRRLGHTRISMRLHLADAVTLLHDAGYGDPQ